MWESQHISALAVCSQDDLQAEVVGFMDQSTVVVGIACFIAGYFFRASFPEPKPETPACRCRCEFTVPQTVEAAQSNTSYSLWIITASILLISLLVLGNTALVCKVTWKDSGTGGDKEFQINVKGKSKGIHGASRGLAITG